MQQLPLSPGQRALAAHATIWACMAAAAWALRQKQRRLRTPGTLAALAVLLVATPLVAGRCDGPGGGQKAAVPLACAAVSIALTIGAWLAQQPGDGFPSAAPCSAWHLYATHWGICMRGAQAAHRRRMLAAAPASRGATGPDTPHATALACAARLALLDVGHAFVLCLGLDRVRSLAALPWGQQCGVTLLIGGLTIVGIELMCLQARLVLMLCGAERLLAAMPPTVLHNPFAACSVQDFWGRRWHQLLRFAFKRYAQLLVSLLPRAARDSPAVFSLAAFLVSGLVHEHVTWAAFGIADGRQLAFFMASGAAVVLEGAVAQRAPRVAAALPRAAKQALTLAFFTLTGRLFVGAWVEGGCLAHLPHPLGAAPGGLSLRLLAHAGVCPSAWLRPLVA